MSGVLSREDLWKQMKSLARRSKDLDDNWQLHQTTIPCGESDFYLTKKAQKLVPSHNPDWIDDAPPVDEIDMGIDDLRKDDNEVLVAVECERLCTIEYSIVYSRSYSVPVLYLSAWGLDGRMLHTEELTTLCSPYHKDHLMSNVWTTLTQVEHPIRQTVCYMLHPCKTSHLMAQLPRGMDDRRENYLIQWLSSVGPAVGLDMPIEYASVQ